MDNKEIPGRNVQPFSDELQSGRCLFGIGRPRNNRGDDLPESHEIIEINTDLSLAEPNIAGNSEHVPVSILKSSVNNIAHGMEEPGVLQHILTEYAAGNQIESDGLLLAVVLKITNDLHGIRHMPAHLDGGSHLYRLTAVQRLDHGEISCFKGPGNSFEEYRSQYVPS